MLGLDNGKDKTSFFAGIQRHHEKSYADIASGRSRSPHKYDVTLSFGGRGYPIDDPSMTCWVLGACPRDPFPGNVIPQNRFDPAAKNILARNPWKAQNDPGTLTPNGPTKQPDRADQGPRSHHSLGTLGSSHQFNSNSNVFAR